MSKAIEKSISLINKEISPIVEMTTKLELTLNQKGQQLLTGLKFILHFYILFG